MGRSQPQEFSYRSVFGCLRSRNTLWKKAFKCWMLTRFRHEMFPFLSFKCSLTNYMFLYKYVIKKGDLCFLGFFAPWKDEKFHKIDVSLPEICSHLLIFFFQLLLDYRYCCNFVESLRKLLSGWTFGFSIWPFKKDSNSCYAV